MQGWKFWENPLVISAFRVKYRRSAPIAILSIYMMLTVTVGILLKYYEVVLSLTIPWERFYFVGLITFQFALSALIASVTTHNSIHSDVINRTFDFQRIAAMPPHQILLGKLLGEPATAYLLITAAIPMLVWCSTLGATSAGVLALLLLNLGTTTLLCGCLGLLHSLEIPENKQSTSNSTAAIVFLALFGLPWMFAIGAQMGVIMGNPWGSAIVGLLTPFGSIYGVSVNDVWGQSLVFFDLRLPLIVLTPIVQLLLAGILFHAMCRRVVSPVRPFLSKTSALVIVIAVEVILAGLFYDPVSGSSFAMKSLAFCAAHLVVSAIAVFAATPGRECLKSWLWRFREQQGTFREFMLGERSQNLGIAAACALVGPIIYIPGVALPEIFRGPGLSNSEEQLFLVGIAVAMALMSLTHSACHQMFYILFGRAGTFLFQGLLGVWFFVPVAVGEIYSSDLWRGLSPMGHVIAEVDQRTETQRMNPVPMFLLYLAMLIFSIWWVKGWLSLHARQIDHTIAKMKAPQAA